MKYLNKINLIKYRIFVGKINDTSKQTWIYQSQLEDSSEWDLYISAFYFTVTTLVTVGYGDIAAYSNEEKLFSIALMLLGVVSFSLTTGTIASIISSYDS
jgi:hypothetical protein